jgi:hypothetical protein
MFPTFKPGKYGQGSTIASSIPQKLNIQHQAPRRDGNLKGIPRPHECTHTLMGVHEGRGGEEIRKSTNIVIVS